MHPPLLLTNFPFLPFSFFILFFTFVCSPYLFFLFSVPSLTYPIYYLSHPSFSLYPSSSPYSSHFFSFFLFFLFLTLLSDPQPTPLFSFLFFSSLSSFSPSPSPYWSHLTCWGVCRHLDCGCGTLPRTHRRREQHCSSGLLETILSDPEHPITLHHIT